MKSTKLLMADHQSILQALHVLAVINEDLAHGKHVNTEDILSLLSFLREFADGSHHVKEEAIFFPALMQAGMSLDEGPLRQMNYEHERGRALIAAMQNAINGSNIDDFLSYSRRYIALQSEHIEKENWVLFEKADQLLNDDEDEKIAAAFEHFETTIVGTPTYERFHEALKCLSSKYLAAAIPLRS
jgi:hemerythrin-like domain-containing protein